MKKLIALLILVLSAIATADTLELRSGGLLNGRYVGGTQSTVRFEVAGNVQTLPVTDILAITFEQGAATPAATPVPAPAAPPAAAPPPPAAASQPVVVPAGTTLQVRTLEPIDSNRHRSGHRFTCTLESDLVVGKQVAAKKGTKVYGELVAAKRSGRLIGRSEMHITLNGIAVNGKIVPLAAGEVSAVSESTTRDTVRRTARGAAIGGLIDGSDGAETGAKVGLGVSVLTRGKSVNIPQGTLLKFPLKAPVTL